MSVSGLRHGLAVFTIGAVVLGACSRKDNAASDTAATGNADGGNVAIGGSVSTTPWNDANIFAVLDEANVADSAHGALAATKGTSSAVRDFGKQMIRDHHNLRLQGEALAKRMKVTPTPPSDDNLVADAQRASDTLNSTAKGKDFDRAYTDHEVEMHKRLLEIVTKSMREAQSTELKDLIQKAAPTIQGHLDKAQSIQQAMK